ncbi:MAG TPA: deiodinase family protein [Planctomycetaceae bacterium]|nr:deiodinase family protein [Planctomycetaceae bacterium]
MGHSSFELALCIAAVLVIAGLACADDAPFPLGPELQNVPLEDIEKAYEGRTAPEGIRMYLAIARGSQMGAGHGWFGPGQSRYDWQWLSQHGEAESSNGGLTQEQFRGSAEWFQRLDRNRDGRISPDDLDWSDDHPWVENAHMVNRLFRKIDPSGDGKLTREEWLAFFDRASANREVVTSAELRDTWLAGMSSNFLPGDAPTKEILLRGLFAGEVGSLQEGPAIGDAAPDFKLQTQDGSQTIQLSRVTGTKPLVLVFGNFTCGPFRSMYPEVDEIARRYRDQATFLAVYVREAHPTDGWAMKSNETAGVRVTQPKSLAERRAVAAQCTQRLKPSIPLLVDDVDDATGHAYSGMPARLYVIDPAGQVAYKGGRGPFGFKAGEMEQALVMTLLDQSLKSAEVK